MTKQSLYQVLVELSESHCKFKSKGKKRGGYADLLRFDLNNRTISNGNTAIMKNGKVNMPKIELTNGKTYDLEGIELLHKSDYINYAQSNNPYEIVEDLYEQYKTSIPSEHSQFSRCNFKALRADDLSMKQLINGIPRIKAQYMLEGFILLASTKRLINWNNEKHFFWQSDKHKELIIYKEWVKPTQKKECVA